FPSDPLAHMKRLPTRPPSFTPGKWLTQERFDALYLNKDQFLTLEEVKLAAWVMKEHEMAFCSLVTVVCPHTFAWTESEIGRFDPAYFDPVIFPTVPHVPWQEKNIPIPPALQDQVIDMLHSKIAAGTYEPSQSSYRSRVFAVTKKSGELRLVIDARPLNSVMIRSSTVPPLTEHILEDYGVRGCYGLLNFYRGFEQHPLHPKSRDYT
ncbi:DNA/RNA polymerase, partial [Calocera cornea HHB12733]